MNAPAIKDTEATEPLPMATRKPIPSMLDPFRDKLLQMEKDKLTNKKMLLWLRIRQMRCSRSTLRHFLATRRAEHNRNHLHMLA